MEDKNDNKEKSQPRQSLGYLKFARGNTQLTDEEVLKFN